MSTSQNEAKGFFSGLFDFGFTTFITLKFLRVIYTVLVVLILLAGAVFLVAALARGGASGILFGLIIIPILTLLYLVIARVSLEAIALFFRIGENTSLLVAATGGPSGPGGFGPSGPAQPFGPPPPTAPAPYAGPAPTTPMPYGEPPESPQR